MRNDNRHPSIAAVWAEFYPSPAGSPRVSVNVLLSNDGRVTSHVNDYGDIVPTARALVALVREARVVVRHVRSKGIEPMGDATRATSDIPTFEVTRGDDDAVTFG